MGISSLFILSLQEAFLIPRLYDRFLLHHTSYNKDFEDLISAKLVLSPSTA
jgi:hypothetical protein